MTKADFQDSPVIVPTRGPGSTPATVLVKVTFEREITRDDVREGVLIPRLIVSDLAIHGVLDEDRVMLKGKMTGDVFVGVATFLLNQDPSGRIEGPLGTSNKESCQLAIIFEPKGPTYGNAEAKTG